MAIVKDGRKHSFENSAHELFKNNIYKYDPQV